MTEKKSLLNSINAKEKLQSGNSPFAKKEKTQAIRIYQSKFDLINLIAFKENKTKKQVSDEILEAGIKKLKLLDKYDFSNK